MSQAFMREREEEWLGEVAPNIGALTRYLTRGNNGVPVREEKNYFDKKLGRQVYKMSNGSCYALDDDGRWSIVG